MIEKRTSASLAATLVMAWLLAGCASAGAESSPPQSPPPVVTTLEASTSAAPTPAPGTVLTYAPDPAQATMHVSWAIDVRDVREVVRAADAVVIARVTGIDAMASFSTAGSGIPATGVNIDVVRVLTGSAPRNGRIAVPGGTVTLQQVFESDPIDSTEKNGIAAMTEAERRRETWVYVTPDPVRLEVGGEYVFMLSLTSEPDLDSVASDGYGVFTRTDAGYTNHLTGTHVTVADLEMLIEETR